MESSPNKGSVMKKIKIKGYWDLIFLEKEKSVWPIPVYHPEIGEFTTSGCFYNSRTNEWELMVKEKLANKIAQGLLKEA